MIEELANKVYEKISKECKIFKKTIMEKGSDYILNNAYEIAIKDEMADIFYGTNSYNKYELLALLNQKNTLDFLYNEWMESDGGIHNIIKDNIEIGITDLATEYTDIILKKLNNNSNKELIEIMANALDDFDNYDFCTRLKNKYGLTHEDSIEPIDIYQIFISDGGKKYLFDIFSDLSTNEHLEYLNDISVINSENYNNINDKILPKLKDLIALENKEKNKKSSERDDR